MGVWSWSPLETHSSGKMNNCLICLQELCWTWVSQVTWPHLSLRTAFIYYIQWQFETGSHLHLDNKVSAEVLVEFFFFINFYCVFVYGVHTIVHVEVRGQFCVYKKWFSPYTVSILEIKLRSSGWCGSTWATEPTLGPAISAVKLNSLTTLWYCSLGATAPSP